MCSSSTHSHCITVIPGDGVGPEVIASAQHILSAAGVKITWEECEAGAKVFQKGISTGVPLETITSIQKNRVVLKGPLQTPVGYGENSANVTLRKFFETFGNIRPIREIPGVSTPYSGRKIDFVIVRENVEDLYAGIEYMATPGVAKCLKIISRKGCEKIVRLAFEVARAEGRQKVHCASKSNIMKMTEGMLKRTFEDIAQEYPEIQSHHIIVDNCAHQLVKNPEQFEVIVTTNMNGDILSDLGSALIGGLGFAPGANIGDNIAIFEAVHGSAPKYAGQNLINPSAVILSAIMMLRYLGEFNAAENIEEALVYTIVEDKFLTQDVAGALPSVSTTKFTEAIIHNLGKKTSLLPQRPNKKLCVPKVSSRPDFVHPKTRDIGGVDIYLEASSSPQHLGDHLRQLIASTPYELSMISSRGAKVYPSIGIMPDVVDYWRCRFFMKDKNAPFTEEAVQSLLDKLRGHYTWESVQRLSVLDGHLGYSKAQGE